MRDQGPGSGEQQPAGEARKKRRWIPILIGVLLLLVVLAVGAVVVTVSWFRQNLTVTHNSEASVTEQFDEVLRRYPGQVPLIQLVDGRPEFVGERVNVTVPRRQLSTVHVLAFDRNQSKDGNTVSFSLPFWLLRMKSGPIRISALRQGWDDRGVAFRVEDIERRGPGIIVDAVEPGEGRVLIWAE